MNIKPDDNKNDGYKDTEPSYEFTGPIPDIDPDDYFALMPTPKGMKPIVDPKTKMCIGYYDKEGAIYDYQGISIGDYNIHDPHDSNVPVEEVLFPLNNRFKVKKNIVGRAIKKVSDFLKKILYL